MLTRATTFRRVKFDHVGHSIHDKLNHFVYTSYKVVESVPNNLCSLLMDKLEPDTTYIVAVTSFAGRNRKRSGNVMFRTYSKTVYISTTFVLNFLLSTFQILISVSYIFIACHLLPNLASACKNKSRMAMLSHTYIYHHHNTCIMP